MYERGREARREEIQEQNQLKKLYSPEQEPLALEIQQLYDRVTILTERLDLANEQIKHLDGRVSNLLNVFDARMKSFMEVLLMRMGFFDLMENIEEDNKRRAAELRKK